MEVSWGCLHGIAFSSINTSWVENPIDSNSRLDWSKKNEHAFCTNSNQFQQYQIGKQASGYPKNTHIKQSVNSIFCKIEKSDKIDMLACRLVTLATIICAMEL